MTLTVLPHHLQSYSLWLSAQNYKPNTVKNYLLDLQAFLRQSQNLLSIETISRFTTSITDQNNASRRLASISKFCQFAFDQKLTGQNLFTEFQKQRLASPHMTLFRLLADFSTHLTRLGKSPITIKNYQGDLKQFIDFCDHRQL